MKFLMSVAAVIFLFSSPLSAQDPVEETLAIVTEALLEAETVSNGGEVLSLMCNKGDDGLTTLVYRRLCALPLGGTDEVTVFYKAGQSSLVEPACGPSSSETQILYFYTDKELAKIGRGLNALCRSLPFDDAAVCK